ncbi:NIPSNAP family protein [Fodinibius sediminis]|uniref:NIPSNAP protein n=1 Tax=Fodinibius sediminis TaxID=1214077 RepID=A0A521EAF3_9BACT|nr:NIPSNAP family protein [Fodinibius sediminis]SMO80894.1 NIPSNAP protein [Fodinibius sediminis]
MMITKRILPLLFLLFFQLISNQAFGQADDTSRDYFQIKVYHFDSADQQQQTDHFLEEAFLPALHRQGIEHVGVFKPHDESESTELKTYVLIPFDSIQAFASLPSKLSSDTRYQADGKDYLQASHEQPPYQRITSTLIRAFEYAPEIMSPSLENPQSERVYELRSYESPTEALNRNKVDMFNAGGEIEIFDRLDFNPIFYGNVISGGAMPNLMYMTSFEDMKSRDAHWDAFRTDKQWEELSSLEKYQNNVSHADIYLLKGTSYSDL